MLKGKGTLQCSFIKDLVTIFIFLLVNLVVYSSNVFEIFFKNEMRNQYLFSVFPTLKILHPKDQILNDK